MSIASRKKRKTVNPERRRFMKQSMDSFLVDMESEDDDDISTEDHDDVPPVTKPSIRKSGRQVTLGPTVNIVETLNLEDYTPREIAASWYDEDEFDRITEKCFKIN